MAACPRLSWGQYLLLSSHSDGPARAGDALTTPLGPSSPFWPAAAAGRFLPGEHLGPQGLIH